MSQPQNWKRAAMLSAFVLTMALQGATNALAQHYTRTDLTADNSSVSPAPNIDPNLVNPWGLARSSGSFWWVSDNGKGLSTLYDGTGLAQQLVVTIPLPNGQSGASAPTGTVFNYTSAFEVASGQPAFFLFATEDGTIAGWNPNVNPQTAVLKVDHSSSAIYKGIALATTAQGPRLYVANFESGAVEVYDGNFHQVKVSGGFLDANLPANYVPFGIQNVGGNIVVAFANRKPGSRDENHGPGRGFVDIFDLNGKLLLRLQHGPFLNAPWGIALAPGDFGSFSHRLLIGNFGDGLIHAFNTVSGKMEGTVLDENGMPLSIGGLWAIAFAGNSAHSGSATELYFTSGPNDEADGIFGKLTPIAGDQRGSTE
jgi:uncharacterized protein (TIGR03118 family)